MVSFFVRLLTGGDSLADQFRKAYEAKLNAQNDTHRLEAERELNRIEAAIETARIANEDRWSATSLGRYLIVIPFGLWWAAIHLDSIINASWVVLALPPAIMEMARWLIPAIIIGDVSRSLGRLVSRRKL